MDTPQTPAVVHNTHADRQASDPSKGNKRLFSETYGEPEHNQESSGYGGNQSAPNTAEKRHRASRWPFHSKDNADTISDNRRGKRFGGSGAGKSTPRRNGRSSRFVEGSMNNKASKKPPHEYFAGYESQSQSEKEEHVDSHEHKPSQAAIMLKDEAAVDEAENRPSGIFKFGSKLAATFNPSKWKIWPKEKPVEDTSIAERLKADAEFKRAYEEVKKRGYIQGNRPAAMASAEKFQRSPNAENVSDIIMEDTRIDNMPAGTGKTPETRTRISGQTSSNKAPNVNTPRRPVSQSELESKYQRPFPRTPIVLPAVTPEDSISNYSPSSISPRRGPSLLLEGAFNDNPSRPTRGRIVEPHPLMEGERERMSPKEIQKQLSLLKKVSTLEFKLRAAQEELALSMGTPLPAEKTRTGIDYEAIHAIQVQHQMRNGMGHLPTVASELMPGYYTRAQKLFENGKNTRASSNLDNVGTPTSSAHSFRAHIASSVNGDLLPPSRLPDAIPTEPLPANDMEIGPRSSAGGEVQESRRDSITQEENTDDLRRGANTAHTKNADVDGGNHGPFCGSDDESADKADSMVTRTASVKHMKSGPQRRSVQVFEVSDIVSKHKSMKGRVEKERGRSLRRPGDEAEFATPELPAIRHRTPSEASVKSSRSSRIPRPRSRAGTPVRERAPPVPAIPVERLEQTGLQPKRSASTKSTKTAKVARPVADIFAVGVSSQHLETPARNETRASGETTPTPKHRRRKSGAAVHRGVSRMSKSPSRESPYAMTRANSTKGGLQNREREMSPSKEGTFEWDPDVF